MMKKMTMMTFLFLGLFTSTTQAQQSINAAGGNATGSEGTVSFSVGQIDYTCYEGTGGTVSQGVQQLAELSEVLTDNFTEIKLEMVIYPNPTTDLVNLKIENYDSDFLSYGLFDMQGRQISTNNITKSETQIQMKNMAAAVYLLTVRDKNKLLKTFKIIKKD
jgi:opacity protein-like surface antigen